MSGGAPERPRLLVVDDEPDVRALVRAVGEGLGQVVEEAGSAQEFRAACLAEAPAVVVLDLVMPGSDGVQLLEFLAVHASRAAVVLISGMDARVLDSATYVGATHGLRMLGALQKPFDLRALEDLLVAAVGHSPEEVSEAALRTAIAGGELVLHYQPKVTLGGDGADAIAGVEALVRWQRPGIGLIMPDAFVPLAEASGLGGALTDWVLEEALAQLGRWDAEGLELAVAVNLPAALLTERDLPERIAARLDAHRLDHGRLTLEVTEGAAMGDPEHAMAVLTRLRLAGVGLSLDDFGTGYSSLVQLYRMPFDELKVDRLFVMDAAEREEAAVIVRSTVALGRNLGLRVCAEGVESEASLERVRGYGCDLAQGYHIGRPVAGAEVPALLERFAGSAQGPGGRSSG